MTEQKPTEAPAARATETVKKDDFREFRAGQAEPAADAGLEPRVAALERALGSFVPHLGDDFRERAKAQPSLEQRVAALEKAAESLFPGNLKAAREAQGK
jgi:hypothetical protein